MSDLKIHQLGFSKTMGIILFGLLLAAPVLSTSLFMPAAAQSNELEAAATNTRFIVLEKPAPSYDKLDVYVVRSTDNGVSWEEPLNLSSNAGNSHYSKILKSSSGAYVVWTQVSSDGTKSDIYFTRSTNDGDSWGSKIKLSSTGTVSGIALIGASGSNVYVVWSDAGTGDVYLRKSANNGGNWASIVNLSSNPGKSDMPDLSVSGSNVYVVWAQASSDGSAKDTFVRASTDGGATWKSKIKLSSSGKADLNSAPSVTSSGSRAYVAWDDGSAGNGDILFRSSTNQGADWGTANNLSSDSARSYAPELAASGTSVYVQYTKRTSTSDYSIIFRASTNNGGTWGTKTTLLTNHFYGIGPAAILTAGNYVHVVIENPEKDNTLLFMRSSANNGASFGPSVDPSSGDYVGKPSVIVSGSNLFAVWLGHQLSSGSGDVITYARSIDNGATWSDPVVIDSYSNRALIA
jgi:hypothetical protein